MVWLSGGTFAMGSNDHYREETPVHRVNVDGFWIDRTEVTNGQYARFTDETGYRTVAERPLDPRLYPGAPPENLAPGSLVFQMTEGPVDLSRIDLWWRWTPGACWCRPKGPGSSIDGCEDHPVVHIAHEDAVAYASWAGKSLPSEAEWEFAARGGLEQQDFVWGQDEKPGEEIMANTWQGSFPWQNLATHGFEETSPVGSFPANGYGLMDMAGNVWEWTADWWTARHPPKPDKPCCVPHNPRGGTIEESIDPAPMAAPIPRKVVKGGSFLCAPNYCLRYRPAARRPQAVDTGTSHIGFRCVLRPEDGR